MGRRPVCALCLILIALMCLADRMGMPLIRGNPLPADLQSWILKRSECELCGEVEQCADTENSQSVYLKDVYLINNSKKVSIGNVRVFLKKREMLPAGSLILVSGKLEPVPGPGNPGEFDSRQYYACRHIYYLMKKGVVWKKSETYSVYQQFLMDLKERFADSLQAGAGEAAPVFEAVVLGDKSDLERDTKLRYQMAGILHILAISGLHISILGIGFYELLKRAGLGIWSAGILSLIVMLNYGVMTGGNVSTMRAVVMFLISVGAKILGRIYDMMTALAVAAILILMESPAYLLDGGFWMSFGAVVGIGVVAPRLQEIFVPENKLGKAFAASFSVQAATLPIVLWFYGEVSVAGIFLNLVVLPTVAVVLLSGAGAALAGLVSLRVSMLCAWPGRALLFVYEFLGTAAGKLPFCTWVGGRPRIWQMVVYYCVMTGTLWFGKQEERQRWMVRSVCVLGMGLAVCILGYRPAEGLRITCLDIGQGDAIVVETPKRQVFLIDGGSSSKSGIGQYQILPFLKNRGISYIDAVFISHTDADHISGIKELLEYMGKDLTSVHIGKLILPGWEKPPEAWEELAVLAGQAGIRVLVGNEGDILPAEELEFRILSPEKGALGENINEESMILQLNYGNFSALFTGDAGMEAEEKIMDSLEDADFLKVGHHGSKYASGERFLEKIKPEISVISVSSKNTYGHPSTETVERLEEAGSQVWCTKDFGAVTVKYENGKIFAKGYCP